jgi:hypothetical protein
MARATSKAGIGQGWHKQSLRHSNARKTGHAGGQYSYAPYIAVSKEGKRTLLYSKNLKEAKAIASLSFAGKGGTVMEWKDSDGDGVPDNKDCQPFNPHAQDTDLLKPEYSRQKSFYKKAKVETDQGNKKLYSYGTLVAEIKDGKPIVYGTYSQTTLKHIKEFLQQSGHKAETSEQIIKDYSPSDKDMEVKQKEAEETVNSQLKTTAMVASLGELFGKTQKEKNDWKTRMLKAGAPQLSIPDDWETLPEAEKEHRLNQVIAIMQEKKKPLRKVEAREAKTKRYHPEKVTSQNQFKWIMEYEGGNLTAGQADELFSYLIKTRQAWNLQGMYGRQAQRLIDSGAMSKEGKILRKPSKELLYEK